MNNITFREELQQLINKHSMENGSNTPDFILAKYLVMCLDAFDVTTNHRTAWYTPPYRPVKEEIKVNKRVRVKNDRAGHGACGSVVGSIKEFNGNLFTPVILDNDVVPCWIRSDGLEEI